jgi:hypothetical protein
VRRHPNDPSLSRLADEELAARIQRFGQQMLEAEERFKTTRSIEDRAARDQAWIARKAHLLELRRRKDVAAQLAANDFDGRGLA